ncbi:MAG: TRAP-type C4-dicarboxylate transport system permease small subunit [Parasphingorhabdus sp.]|jgi:TRAP-type C4-dicarboxylate transport system permease small subunit
MNNADAWRQKLENWLRRVLGGFGAALLFFMMALTFVDVLGRYFFDAPVKGGFEITEFVLATLIFAGLPLVTARGEHVTVDLFDRFVPSGIARVRDFLLDLLGAGVMGLLCQRMWIKSFEAVGYGDSSAVLQFPIYPAYFFMCAMLAATCLIYLLMAWIKLVSRSA